MSFWSILRAILTLVAMTCAAFGVFYLLLAFAQI